jgi:acetolactate decarboxylase
VAFTGPFGETELEAHLGERVSRAARPTAIRIDGAFAEVHVRSVPRQKPPYRPLAEVIAQQQINVLRDVSGTMMGFCFPEALDGIEMVGSHLHFLSDDRTRGGHVLSYTLLQASARLDAATRLHVELPGAVALPRHGASLDQTALHRLESDR